MMSLRTTTLPFRFACLQACPQRPLQLHGVVLLPRYRVLDNLDCPQGRVKRSPLPNGGTPSSRLLPACALPALRARISLQHVLASLDP